MILYQFPVRRKSFNIWKRNQASLNQALGKKMGVTKSTVHRLIVKMREGKLVDLGGNRITTKGRTSIKGYEETM